MTTIDRLLTRPVIVHHRSQGTVRDEYGNVTAADTSTTTYKGELQQAGASENLRDRNTLNTDYRLWLPADAVIDANDTVTVGMVTYEVVGQPSQIWNPRTVAVSHIEADLRVST